MKGGNEVSVANGITHSPLGEQNAKKLGYQKDEAEKVSGSQIKSATGKRLDGTAVKL